MQYMRQYLSSKKYSMLIAISLLIYSILRGIRFPNVWSYTHYLFNYNHGFVKRGIVGTIVGYFDIPVMLSYTFFIILSFSLFAVSIFLIFRLIKNRLSEENLYFNICVYLFLTSSGVIYLTHTVGYFDHIGLLTALIVLNISSFRLKLTFAFPVFVFCMFVHEAMLAMFFPVIFISILNEIKRDNASYRVAALIIFSVISIVASYSLAQSTLTEKEAFQSYEETQSKIEVSIRKDAYEVQFRSVRDNLDIMGYIGSLPNIVRHYSIGFLETLPTAVFITFILIVYLRQINIHPIIISLSVLASYSPLMLHFIAWDMHRFNALAVVTTFLVFLAHTSTSTEPIRLSKIGEGIASSCFVAIFICNVVVKFPLFDEYQVKNIPFSEHVQYIKNVINGKEEFPYIPKF